MSQSAATGGPRSAAGFREATGWTGWIAFAGIMMIIIGCLQVFYGLIAMVNDEWIVWGNQGALLLDFTLWGWVHLALGAVLILSGIGVFTGNLAARVAGVVFASLSLISNFLFLPAYPIWSLVVVTIDALVIYALIAHGQEMTAT